MSEQQTLAKAIRAGRAVLGWSQADLARLTGLSLPTVTRLEIGSNEPRYETVRRILEIFRCSGLVVEISNSGKIQLVFEAAGSAPADRSGLQRRSNIKQSRIQTRESESPANRGLMQNEN